MLHLSCFRNGLGSRECTFLILQRRPNYYGRLHKPAPAYTVDQLIREHGHEVLRLPPYHPDCNAIELIWSQLKSIVRTRNLTFRFMYYKYYLIFMQIHCIKVAYFKLLYILSISFIFRLDYTLKIARAAFGEKGADRLSNACAHVEMS